MKQVCNPILPSWDYIPDGEPHVFGDRVYLFGSHDRFGGSKFCMNDYVCWSAPINDLSNWRKEGTIYTRTQDPDNPQGKYELWAPDVAQGPDGRYYLYYCLADRDKIGVAVCDTPAGKYEFLGHVQDKTGACLGTRSGDTIPFDPAVLVDGGRVFLYSGNGPLNVKADKKRRKASCVMELEPDMRTLKTEPKPLIPTLHTSSGTDFAGHEFFEASSIRKFEGKYYFIYSSVQCHYLCWAVSDRPDGGFTYGGTLVSNGGVAENAKIDTGFNAAANPQVKYYMGNNHGSVEKIEDRYYVFYHRQTNRRMTCRQACAEPVRFENGKFYHTEKTSRGLNGGPLSGKGTYEAGIACHLWSKKGALFSAHPMVQNKKHPAITQLGEDREEKPFQYVQNLRDGACAGYRSFRFEEAKGISVQIRGKCKGELVVYDEEKGNTVAVIPVQPSKDWTDFSSSLKIANGIHPLYFVFRGKGSLDLASFTLR